MLAAQGAEARRGHRAQGRRGQALSTGSSSAPRRRRPPGSRCARTTTRRSSRRGWPPISRETALVAPYYAKRGQADRDRRHAADRRGGRDRKALARHCIWRRPGWPAIDRVDDRADRLVIAVRDAVEKQQHPAIDGGDSRPIRALRETGSRFLRAMRAAQRPASAARAQSSFWRRAQGVGRQESDWPVSLASTFRPNKRVVIALQYIHGIGPAKAKEICQKVGIAADAASTS